MGKGQGTLGALLGLLMAVALLQGCTSKELMLNHAIINDDVRSAKRQLAAGVDPNVLINPHYRHVGGGSLKVNGNYRPLWGAVLAYEGEPDKRNLEILYLLIQAGADPNLPLDHRGWTPVFVAERPETIRALVNAGANVNHQDANGNTPLHDAWTPEAATTLLQAGADPTIRNHSGLTPLDWHSLRHNAELACADAGSEGAESRSQHEANMAAQRCQNQRLEAGLAAGEPVTRPDTLEQTGPGTVVMILADAKARPANTAGAVAGSAREGVAALLIPDSSGPFLSPYTSDGVTAEWVNQAINASTGSAVGSAAGAAAGNYIAGKALENVPFGGLIGSIAGSKLGAAAGREVAVDEQHMRASSDQSFRSLYDMARYLVHTHGDKNNFAEVAQATDHVYPGFLATVRRLSGQ